MFQITSLRTEKVTSSASQIFENCMEVVEIANLIVLREKHDNFVMALSTSTTNLTNEFPINETNSIMRKFELQ